MPVEGVKVLGDGMATVVPPEADTDEQRAWTRCWEAMVFRDLHGYPLWMNQLHDVIRPAFADLQSIFVYYRSCSTQGTETIGNANKLGLMEMLQMAKDVELFSPHFKAPDLERQFHIANNQEALAQSGSADRHTASAEQRHKSGFIRPTSARGLAKSNSSPHAGRSPPTSARASHQPPSMAERIRMARGVTKETVRPDAQLTLSEFVNCLVRIAFWRANPTWGHKENRIELTPVPECAELLLAKVILPRACRDTSAEFKALLARDLPTKDVLSEYRVKLTGWAKMVWCGIRGYAVAPENWLEGFALSYHDWIDLMDGTRVGSNREDVSWASHMNQKRAARCPKMVGEWFLRQESEITGDERVAPHMQMTFHAKLSIAQVRFNFIHSQQVQRADVEGAEMTTLSFDELLECMVRCAVDTYAQPITVFLASHGRHAMDMADATRCWLHNLLWEKSPELCMWEQTVLRAPRFDWQRFQVRLPAYTDAHHQLWVRCWQDLPLMDLHHFPLWERGVHDVLQKRFPDLISIYSHYTKGVSGVGSAANALEMSLEEFHDFVKDAKLETRMTNWTAISKVFAKANATATAEAYSVYVRSRRNAQVVMEQEQIAAAETKRALKKERETRRSGNYAVKKEGLEGAFFKNKEVASSNLSLTEFLGVLVRLSFLRANPRHGQGDRSVRLIELPGCLKRMLEESVLVFAKRDTSHLFRQKIAQDDEVQAVFTQYAAKLKQYYNVMSQLQTSASDKRSPAFTLETFLMICSGAVRYVKGKAVKNDPNADAGQSSGLGVSAIVGECTVKRESAITGDERTKETFTCRLTTLEAKYAFLHSQSLEQMGAGDAKSTDKMATLDYDEFLEALARCARDKYGEISTEHMSLADGVRGVIQNVLGEKSDEAVLRDATYIHATRYDWAMSKPLANQSVHMHQKWLSCWQCIEVADLHYFPMWEKQVHDCLQEAFPELERVFAHYCKSIGGSVTAEDAVEMTMTEFKKLAADASLPTKDFPWEVMQNMFKKANALNNNAAHAQHKLSRGSSEVYRAGTGAKLKSLRDTLTGKRTAKAAKAKEHELDQELVLHEFIELLIRIAFWRANPYHGLPKPPVVKPLVPLPDCLDTLVNGLILPSAKRDDSAAFKTKLVSDKQMLEALSIHEEALQVWFDHHAPPGGPAGRKLQYQQWLDLLMHGYGSKPGVRGYSPGHEVGEWEIYQDSEITGDERCRNKFQVKLSLPTAKLAFINSQSLDQLSIGQMSESDAMTTLDFGEFKECLARCGTEKYKTIDAMSDGVRVSCFIKNVLGIENTEESINTATLIKAERFNWKRSSLPLEGQSVKNHRKWLAVWSRLELSDMYYFPLWEARVHDLLQKHFEDLSLIFLAYCRSVLGSDSAEDALEMEMAEFKDFVDECKLETRYVSFDLMTNSFIKANATNSAQVRDAHHESRRSAGTKMDGRTTEEVAKVKGSNDGRDAAKDQELVLYEFIALLVRIAFQRANPTFGVFGNKKAVTHLVHYPGCATEGRGCLESMLEDEILPRARKDTSAIFRETVMTELSVQAVIDEYRPRLKAWFDKTCADYSVAAATLTKDRLTMEHFLHICEADEGAALGFTSGKDGIVGDWDCYRESDYTSDPRCRKQYKWKLSMHQVRMAFMNSQPADALRAAKASATDTMNVLDFGEFVECLCRIGIDKYAGVKEDMAPADAVRGSFLNLLGEQTPDEVVIRATRIPAARYDARNDSKPIKNDHNGLRKWLACWERMEIMDLHMWPLWEKEVHDILQPLFKELQLIFLAYTRSISEDSAEDAFEMSLDEFHDFVIDVGLETKDYKFDVMSNQFIKANAINVAQVREQRQQEKRDAQSHGNDAPGWKQKEDAPKKLKGTLGEEAVKDQELVLYEFLALLVRIAFWRANPKFGLHGFKGEPTLPPLALSTMLNEIILPKAKREASANFRENEMADPKLAAMLKTFQPRLQEWYDRHVGKQTSASGKRTLLDFDTWLHVLTQRGLVGEWEIEQLSAITGDDSTKGNIKIRLSIPTCKAAFMDSQRVSQLGVAQAHAGSAQAVLDLEEWGEALARVALNKYGPIKQLDNAHKLEAFLLNWFGEKSEEEVMREATYIHAVRFDARASSAPLEDESKEQHDAYLAVWESMRLDQLYGFPLWEAEVHNMLHEHFAVLSSIFRAYCQSVGERRGSDATAETMSLSEFREFSFDVGLETTLSTNRAATPARYTFESQMKPAFFESNRSGKGLAGPEADAELTLSEFLSLLLRVSFGRLNPEYGELTMEHQDTLLPVPQALEQTLTEAVLPRAQRDDAEAFRANVMSLDEVQGAIRAARPRLQVWFARHATVGKMGVAQWTHALHAAKVIGQTSVERRSDVVGDDRIGETFTCRLSEAAAKIAFVASQHESADSADGSEDTQLDVEECMEAIARCGVIAYRAMGKYMHVGAQVAAFISTVLVDRTAAQVLDDATYIRAERYAPEHAQVVRLGVNAETIPAWLATWARLRLSDLPGFPLWDRAVHDALAVELPALTSIFNAYAASTYTASTKTTNTPAALPIGGQATMDRDEFHDFLVEADLATVEYGIDTMSGQFAKANRGSKDDELELHEFLSMLVHIAFFRANPQYGMRIGKDQKNADAFGAEVPLPSCLVELLTSKILPNSRRDTDAAVFAASVLQDDGVVHALAQHEQLISTMFEMVSAGREYLQLTQWLRHLEAKLLLSHVVIDGATVRLTEPQVRRSFLESAAAPGKGLLPAELPSCIARTACEKYRGVTGLSAAGKINAFLANVFNNTDEEAAITAAMAAGEATVPPATPNAPESSGQTMPSLPQPSTPAAGAPAQDQQKVEPPIPLPLPTAPEAQVRPAGVWHIK